MRPSIIKMGGILIDCPDASLLADFYAKLLGWNKVNDADGWAAIQSPGQVYTVGFQSVDNYFRPVWPQKDGEQAQMMHLDLSCKDVEAAVAFALECGAVTADVQYFEPAKTMLDPAAGHPFCLCPEFMQQF